MVGAMLFTMSATDALAQPSVVVDVELVRLALGATISAVRAVQPSDSRTIVNVPKTCGDASCSMKPSTRESESSTIMAVEPLILQK